LATLTVDPIQEYSNALLMTWQHHINKDDVAPAFEKIVDFLEASPEPVYVVVDLLENPKFPLVETMRRALKAYDHPRLKAWLVVGSNPLAKQIESFLSMITGRKNVFWFDTMEQAHTYIQKY
jgi:hypothetical protein